MIRYWIYRLLSLVPLMVLYRVSDLLAPFMFYVVRYRRKTVMKNLKNAFPGKPSSWHRETTKAFYRQFVDVTFEVIWAYRMTTADIKDRVKFIGFENLRQQIIDEGTSGIILTMHHTNWEWMMQRASLFFDVPVDAVYKPLHDKSADRFAFETRARMGGNPVAMKDVSRHILKHRRKQRVIALIADQSPGKREKIVWTQFLNQETAFFSGPAVIAKLTGFPVYFAACHREKRGFYRVTLHPLIENSDFVSEQELIERYSSLAEATIRSQPEGYLWSNRRWKLSPTEKNRSHFETSSQPNPFD